MVPSLRQMPRLVSLAVITTLIAFLGITFYKVVAPFVLPLFLSAIVAVLCRPWFLRVAAWTGGRARIAAALTTAAALAVVFVPLLVGTILAAVQLSALAQDTLQDSAWRDAWRTIRTELEIDHLVGRLEPIVGTRLDPDELQKQVDATIRSLASTLAQRSLGLAAIPLGLLGTVVSGVVSVGIFLLGLYYFLADGPALVRATEALIPVHADYQRQLAARFESVIRATVLATLAAAVAQGLATGIALRLAGFHQFFLLSALATLVSMIPVAGAWLVWGPCALWLACTGHWGSAVVLTLFGLVVVGTMDNVIRAWVLHSDARLHPLLAFVSVLGGVQAMGLWGIFVGPIVAACLHALIEIFNQELKEFSRARRGEDGGAPRGASESKSGAETSSTAEPNAAREPRAASQTSAAQEAPPSGDGRSAAAPGGSASASSPPDRAAGESAPTDGTSSPVSPRAGSA